MTNRFLTLPVATVRKETEGAIVVGFRPPAPAAFVFHPGQYLTLRTDIAGEAEQRCYSICSTPDAPTIDIAIKRVPGGRFSEWAHRVLKPGVEVDVSPPEGRFGLAPDPSAARSYLAIAAGSGVTPIMSLAETLLATEPGSDVTFVYGNRTTGSIMFREALDDLKDRYLDRFSLIHVLSGEALDVPLFHGRIDGQRLSELSDAGLIDASFADAIFLCGPGDMPEIARTALIAQGANERAIHMERFLPTPGGANIDVSIPRETNSTFVVTAIADGAARQFEMRADDTSAITAAERAGIELPSSCRGGMCCTCRARVVEGEAEMAVNYSLEPWELEAGFVLACQTRPKSPSLTLDFDAV
ncbi:MAG: 2Fe-2S iron-sulfur cluster-binding protein [Alphaproteobacteria bacterium]|jgi:ring-1,2-phenylacetyl-CoA epoxidase subunit PaaE